MDLEHHILLSAACDRQGLGVNPLLTLLLFVRGGCSREKIVLVREAINYTLSEVVVVFLPAAERYGFKVKLLY